MTNEKRLIDANELLELYDMGEELEEYAGVLSVPIPVIRQNIKDMPTVEAVEVVHGEWIRCLDVDDVEYIECPLCGGEFYDGDNDTFDKPCNYCPNCGAKMDGGEGSA